jgi:hypothetical protein
VELDAIVVGRTWLGLSSRTFGLGTMWTSAATSYMAKRGRGDARLGGEGDRRARVPSFRDVIGDRGAGPYYGVVPYRLQERFGTFEDVAVRRSWTWSSILGKSTCFDLRSMCFCPTSAPKSMIGTPPAVICIFGSVEPHGAPLFAAAGDGEWITALGVWVHLWSL